MEHTRSTHDETPSRVTRSPRTIVSTAVYSGASVSPPCRWKRRPRCRSAQVQTPLDASESAVVRLRHVFRPVPERHHVRLRTPRRRGVCRGWEPGRSIRPRVPSSSPPPPPPPSPHGVDLFLQFRVRSLRRLAKRPESFGDVRLAFLRRRERRARLRRRVRRRAHLVPERRRRRRLRRPRLAPRVNHRRFGPPPSPPRVPCDSTTRPSRCATPRGRAHHVQFLHHRVREGGDGGADAFDLRREVRERLARRRLLRACDACSRRRSSTVLWSCLTTRVFGS